MSIKNEWINRIASADNEFIRIYKDKDEYVIEIDMWYGAKKILKTVNCEKIVYDEDELSGIGDIFYNDRTYTFMDVCDEEKILEIVADEIIMIE